MQKLISSLPARTKAEIEFIVKLAQKRQDMETEKACAFALQRAQPVDDEARAALEAAQTIGIPEIERVAKARLKQR